MNILLLKINIVDSSSVYHEYTLPCLMMSCKDTKKFLMYSIVFTYSTRFYHR